MARKFNILVIPEYRFVRNCHFDRSNFAQLAATEWGILPVVTELSKTTEASPITEWVGVITDLVLREGGIYGDLMFLNDDYITGNIPKVSPSLAGRVVEIDGENYAADLRPIEFKFVGWDV